MARSATAIVGACGEHYIAAYLSGFKLIVAMPRGGIPGSDLFVSRERGGRTLRVQVKTATQARWNDKKHGAYYNWPTKYSAIERDDRHLWYACVWLNGWPEEDNLPEVFFVPSKDVVDRMKRDREEKETFPSFWMRVAEADPYRGQAGLRSFLEDLDS